ncbi:MAG: MobA/MobL family protein [Rhodanobacter sp.]|nr:MobA/MobL family protein [Rhodanobacter sp.]
MSRSQGGSAVAGAAYRAGLSLLDERTMERHDYTRKAGVVASEVLTPEGAPEWAHDPGQLWNAAEAAENRKNSVVAREFLVSLPHELTDEQRTDLARDLTRDLVDRFGFAAMFAVHAPDKKGDDRNHHAHILATTRAMGPDGLGAKTRELDDRKTGAVDEVRAMVGDTINAHLARAGLAIRVDHRSLVERQALAAEVGDFATVAKLERTPEPKIGRAATAAARAGKRSPRFSRAEITRRENEQQAQAHEARFQQLKAEAQAAGRLTPTDEQAAHARALLERTHEGRARLRKAHTDTPTRSSRHGTRTSTNTRGLGAPLTRSSRYSGGDRNHRHADGLGALPAVRPLNRASAFGGNGGHAGGPGTHASGTGHLLRPNAPRHTGAGSTLQRLRAERIARAPVAATRPGRIQGNGTKEGNRAAKAANDYIEALDALVRDAIRVALAWAKDHSDPWPRAMARDFQRAAGEAVSAKTAHDDARTAHRKARRDRHEADHLKPEAKGLAKAVGWKTAAVRQGERAHQEAKQAAAEAKAWRHESGQLQKQAEAEAEKHQKALVDAWKKAHPEHIDRFPEQRTATPVPTPLPTPGQRPGSVSGFNPPRLEPPSPPLPKIRR